MPHNENTCVILSQLDRKGNYNSSRQKPEKYIPLIHALILPTLRRQGFQEENIEVSQGRNKEFIDERLRDADLCIADLTSLNPYVMYGYGLRVGIGKPVIAITTDNTTELFFEASNVQLLQCDVDTIKGLMDSQQKLETIVQGCISEGFSPKTGSGSYAELSERLKAIELRLDKLIPDEHLVHASTKRDNSDEVVKRLGSIKMAFNYALRNKDVRLGEELMPRLKEQLTPEHYMYLVVGQLSAIGSKLAAAELKESWASVVDKLSLREQLNVMAGYISFCNQFDMEVEELRFVAEELLRITERIRASDLDDQNKNELLAGVNNQTNRLYYGAYVTSNHGSDTESHPEWLKKAIDSLQEAIKLAPNEASYHFNLALCLDEAGRLDDAKEEIDRCLSISTEDSSHLRLAYDIYNRIGDDVRAKEVKEILSRINPTAAELL